MWFRRKKDPKPAVMKRSEFIRNTSIATAGLILSGSIPALAGGFAKKRIAVVGMGHRGTGFWGRTVVQNFSDVVDYVGLCDINPGRLEFAKKTLGVNCPTFTDYGAMLKAVKPEICQASPSGISNIDRFLPP